MGIKMKNTDTNSGNNIQSKAEMVSIMNLASKDARWLIEISEEKQKTVQRMKEYQRPDQQNMCLERKAWNFIQKHQSVGEFKS